MKRDVNGLLVIDKPSGITSREAVNRVQGWFRRRTRIGHTGTLDPLATGVLVVCLGNATRLAEYVQGMDKVYRSRWLLGARSDTDDADGVVTPSPDVTPIDAESIRAALAGLIGDIEQTPPAYSAIKIEGKRAHDLARRGKNVEMAPRKVAIDSIDILDYCWPELEVEIHCGKGTYIRSLARDLGERLGCGAYVQQLRRTRVGPFTAEAGLSLDHPPEKVAERLLPLTAAVAHLPSFPADTAAIDALRHGQPVAAASHRATTPGGEAAIVADGGALIGIGRFEASGLLWPLKILASD